MKKNNTYKKWLSVIAICTITFIAVISCENPLKDFTVAIDTAVFQKNATITIFDPTNPTNLDGTGKVEIELLGDDAGKIVSDGGSKTNFPVVDGVLQLAVNPANAGENINFVVKVSGDDYLTTTIPVNINENDTLVTIAANMVNINDTADGINLMEDDKSLNNGTLEEDFVVATDNSGDNEATEVTIASGTEFKDANGNLIKGAGDLKVRVVNFGSQDDESLNSFPGGFSPAAIELENGEIDTEGSFSTAGFTSIDMFVGNTEVKEFSEPITIKMDVDSEVVNPNTGEKIKKGDILPVWSYSKDDGKWKYHCDTTVEEEDGQLFTVCTTTHLSWYNLDYWARGCTSRRRFDVNVVAPGVSSSSGYRLVTALVFAGTNQSVSYKSNRVQNFFNGRSFGYYRTPNANLQFVVYDGTSRYNKGNEIYRSNTFNGCDSNQITINLEEFRSSLPPQPVNVNINFSGNCDGNIIKPSSYLYMKTDYTYRGRTYTYWRYAGYIRSGRVTIYNVFLNREYEFKTYYKGVEYKHNYTFTSNTINIENFDIPAELCNSL
ncbi:hypothetical protein DUT90_07555 [Polaribacter sp. WD7]|uniref:hypothetical protein n=1 Tax=Polaribacter sp. WD7 TaxID=2269061 RepID=UPI000DF185A6|nr:hypothetical protein [Polaribacter sp. WD7]RCS26963.1 hypothetical protein DUT90_07555 [Polaribacter sp. WD7]